MSDPDQLAADARTTQDALGKDVTRLTGRVNPDKFVGTRREKITHSFATIKDQVMGIGDSAAQAAKTGRTPQPARPRTRKTLPGTQLGQPRTRYRKRPRATR